MADPIPQPVSPPSPPPGLINTGTSAPDSGPPVTSYNPATAKAATVTPEAFTVTPDQTVAGQLRGIIDAGSPLMQQAEAHARQTMNARGLINSTQAITAGHSAVIGSALPIAQADAATYERAATNTTQAKNTAGLQTQQIETQTNQFNATQQNTALGQGAAAANQTNIEKMNIDSRERLQAMVNNASLRNIMEQGKIQERLAEIEGKNKLALQTSASASQVYNTAIANIAKIMDSTDHDYEWKMAASNNIVQSLNASLETMSTISKIPGIETTLNFA